MTDATKHTFDFLSKNGKQFLNTWYLVVTKRHRAFNDIDIKDADTFAKSLKFLAFIGMFHVVTDLPVASISGFRFESIYYITSSFLLFLILCLCHATILHTVMKSFSGKAKYRETVSVFCFASAFYPPIMLLQIPVALHVVPIFKDSPDMLGAAVELATSKLAEGMTEEVFFGIVSHFLSLIVFIWYITVLFKSCHSIHEIYGIKAFSADILYIVFLILFFLLVGGPLIHLNLLAFA